MGGRLQQGWRRAAIALVACAYVAGGLGPAGSALATLLAGGRGQAPGACGCAEGEACCGAACCAPAAAAVVPDCCAIDVAEAGPSCCEDPAAVAVDPAPVAELALVSRCTCGQRDHQSACVHLLDAHLPAVTRSGACPPPSSRLAFDRAAARAVWRPEPRDRVPKPSCVHA